jgi:hypothetical protein
MGLRRTSSGDRTGQFRHGLSECLTSSPRAPRDWVILIISGLPSSFHFGLMTWVNFRWSHGGPYNLPAKPDFQSPPKIPPQCSTPTAPCGLQSEGIRSSLTPAASKHPRYPTDSLYDLICDDETITTIRIFGVGDEPNHIWQVGIPRYLSRIGSFQPTHSTDQNFVTDGPPKIYTYTIHLIIHDDGGPEEKIGCSHWSDSLKPNQNKCMSTECGARHLIDVCSAIA